MRGLESNYQFTIKGVATKGVQCIKSKGAIYVMAKTEEIATERSGICFVRKML